MNIIIERKLIKGFENYYIYNDGRVYSKNKNDFMKLGTTEDGYKQVCLSNKGKTKTFKVHRLVAIHFIENNLSKPQVNHIDENKNNNNYKNLEWMTNKENMNHGTRNKRISEKMINLTSKKVKMFSLDGTLLKTFEGLSEAERQTGIFASNICKCDKGERKTAGGFKWEVIR
ncbi:HNH endonuclease [Lactococcus phage CHPC958]|uniref:HNH homing endonuclease n=1 Tax=Lactococcus phage CHPC958 TaxID=2675254 RepID=A0A650EUJ7_9CAUD|nr:HNH endonuclease [Lactococcus phage CHPC958]QGT53228.1 HNH homing endonuclease [Lactococcus phage CHPC958]